MNKVATEYRRKHDTIIGAVCKDGVVIRSDKRRKVTNRIGVEIHDDMEKILVPKSEYAIIYNHGINVINGKSWIDFAKDIATAIDGMFNVTIEKALAAAETILSADVDMEIANNQFESFCAFMILLKSSGQWKVGEVAWERGAGISKQYPGSFFWSGSGSKYISLTAQQKESYYWDRMATISAKKEIAKIYNQAAEPQAFGNEFSATFDETIVH